MKPLQTSIAICESSNCEVLGLSSNIEELRITFPVVRNMISLNSEHVPAWSEGPLEPLQRWVLLS